MVYHVAATRFHREGRAVARKKQAKAGGDRHRETAHVRLPGAYHAMLREIAQENDRAMSRELLRALDAHFRAHGKEPPAKG